MRYKRTEYLSKEGVAGAIASSAEEHLIAAAEHDAWMKMLPDLKKYNPPTVTTNERGGVEISIEITIPQWRTVEENPPRIGLYLVTNGDAIGIELWDNVWEVHDSHCWAANSITHWTFLPDTPGKD